MSSRDLLLAAAGGSTPPAPPVTVPFNQVSLLLQGDGTNGAQNNTFLDSSTNNFTVTRNGNTTQGTNTPFSQAAGYWSNYFPGATTNYIDTPASANFTLNADFTVEMWINNYSGSSFQNLFVLGEYTDGIMIRINTSDSIYINGGFGYVNNLYQYTNSGQWMHLAFSRTGSTLKIFVNGTQQYSGTFTATLNAAASSVRIGAGKSNGGSINGYISNLRIVKGTGLYSTAFTPSTTPLTAVTNTQLLTCQSNYFKDNSSNNFAFTTAGTPSVQPFSPFAPTSAYSTSVNGGSMYFDGTGDYLTAPSSSAYSFGTGDYTIEGWVNLNSATQYYPIVFGIGTASNTASQVIGVLFGDAGYSYGIGLVLNGSITWFTGTPQSKFSNSWGHIAVVRSSGTITLYVNGVSIYSVANSTNLSSTYQVYVGSWATFYLGGYISNLRIVKGTAVYTANFTPPTAPLTAITNTQLLLSGTNAGIVDNAMKNDLETIGTAQVSTSVKKFGTGSIYINGNGQYLTAPVSRQLLFGNGDFTIECWINAPSTQAAYAGIYVSRNGVQQLAFQFNGSGTGIEAWLGSTQVASSSTNITGGSWNHIAFVRYNGVCKIYTNGVAGAGSATYATAIDSSIPFIGVDTYSPTTRYFNGYIDDLRITKGVARYTANFTPPTAAFPNQ